MTDLSDTANFARKLREIFDAFRQHETVIRDQYARDPATAPAPAPLLERATRRFLIDDFLRALDWEVNDPSTVVEEARAKTATGERLYFDYLGLNPKTQVPVLLFEAKGFDIPLPRKPHGQALSSKEMSSVIAEAVDAIKRSDKSLPVISGWAEYLRDLHTYIGSLDKLGSATLQRAAISAGGWIIVFDQPIAVFRDATRASVEHIHCFIDADDILGRHEDLYALLHRKRLTDTLPLTLKVGESLRVLSTKIITDCFRAVLVTTSTSSGSRRQHYPTRTVYAALLVRAGDRWFAIIDYDCPLEEPRSAERIDAFLAELDLHGAKFESTLASRFGCTFALLSIGRFPGFPPSRDTGGAALSAIAPVAGSTADRQQSIVTQRKAYVCYSGEPGAPSEFIVVTGTERFYKKDRAVGTECLFHLWKQARAANAADDAAHTGYVADSFTDDGQDRHCAHNHLAHLRAERCQVRPIETHLCCRTCLFEADCWQDPADQARLPCPEN